MSSAFASSVIRYSFASANAACASSGVQYGRVSDARQPKDHTAEDCAFCAQARGTIEDGLRQQMSTLRTKLATLDAADVCNVSPTGSYSRSPYRLCGFFPPLQITDRHPHGHDAPTHYDDALPGTPRSHGLVQLALASSRAEQDGHAGPVHRHAYFRSATILGSHLVVGLSGAVLETPTESRTRTFCPARSTALAGVAREHRARTERLVQLRCTLAQALAHKCKGRASAAWPRFTSRTQP